MIVPMIVYRAAGLFADEQGVECRVWGRTLKGTRVPLGRWQKALPSGDPGAYWDAWAAAAAELKAGLRSKPDRLVLVLPPGETVVFRLTLPQSARSHVVQAVAYDLERHVPWDASDTLFALDAVNPDDEGALNVLVGAMHRERLDSYVRPLEAVGLGPHLVLTVTQAVCRATSHAFGDRLPPEDMVLGRPVRRGWWLVAYHKGRPVHAAFAQAEQDRTVDRRQWASRAAAFGDELGLRPTRFLDDLLPRNGEPGTADGAPREEPTQVGAGPTAPDVASGAALAGLELPMDSPANLMPKERRRRPSRWPLIVIGLLVASLLGLLLSLPYARVVRLEKQSEVLTRVLSEKKKHLAQIQKLQRENERLEERIRWFSQQEPPVNFLALLESLTRTLPPSSWIRSLSWRQDSLTLSGDTPSSAKLLEILSKDPYLKDVQFISAARRAKDLETFRFKAQVVRPGHGKGTDE